MVSVAQLARALDCGSRGRGFEAPHSPQFSKDFYWPKRPNPDDPIGAIRVVLKYGLMVR